VHPHPLVGVGFQEALDEFYRQRATWARLTSSLAPNLLVQQAKAA
jgi:hypothetical protein